MAVRRRPVLLALLALAAPLPALATSNQALTPVPGPAVLSVSTSLDSCGVLDAQVVCKLDVSYTALPGATSYTATVTRADGSVVDYGAVGAGGTSLWVPYVGSGHYSVRITAYGAPQQPGNEHGEVISTSVSKARADGKGARRLDAGRGGSVDAQAGPRGELGGAAGTTDGDLETAPACSETSPPPASPAIPPEPTQPPPDLDPENPDEDADAIADEQERTEYERLVAEREAAIAAAEAQAQLPETVQCPPDDAAPAGRRSR